MRNKSLCFVFFIGTQLFVNTNPATAQNKTYIVRAIKNIHSGMLSFALIITTFVLVSACSSQKNEPAANGKDTAITKQVSINAKQPEVKQTNIKQAKPIEVFDGRNYEVKNTAPSAPEKALVEKEVRFRAEEDFLKKRLDGLTVNFDEDFSVTDTAEGAFTKPNAKQKAFLYRYSYTNGVVIIEDEKVIGHFSGDPGDYALYFRIKSSPDANQNGLSEIILLRNVEDTEQIYAHLFEFNRSNLEFLGQADFYSSNVEGGGDEIPAEKVEQTGYVVSVQPSATPAFFREKYTKVGSGKWVLTKKAEKFSLDKNIEVKLTKID